MVPLAPNSYLPLVPPLSEIEVDVDLAETESTGTGYCGA